MTKEGRVKRSDGRDVSGQEKLVASLSCVAA